LLRRALADENYCAESAELKKEKGKAADSVPAAS